LAEAPAEGDRAFRQSVHWVLPKVRRYGGLEWRKLAVWWSYLIYRFFNLF
jgi:hypothetical protein